jgi:hypothetical protein
VDLLPFVLRRQHDLVLKRGTGGGVVHGQSVTADRWHEAVAAADGGWVVQDLVPAQPYPLPRISQEGSGSSVGQGGPGVRAVPVRASTGSYICSGAAIPSSDRPSTSTSDVSWASMRRESRISAGTPSLSTGQLS